VQWDHGAMTGTALSPAHRTLSCQSCHGNNTFRAAQTTCISCHQQDFQSARTPNHVAAGFPTACEACHKPGDTSFHQARFDHGSFPLVGVHAQQTCATCHKGNVYVGTPRDCIGCHRTDYDRTTTPNHAAAGFPTTCESCHRPTDTSFRGAGFNHATVFPLLGVHAQQTCATCHRNGVYKGTTRTCVGCHLDAYNRTTNPNHVAAGFPTTCDSCHRNTDTSWTQGTFNHRFPITSGPHRVACTQCHTGGTFQTFNCLSCHGRTETDGHHRSIAGYRYDSLACYSCHPNGRH
jgi:decaheme cytochrome c component MtrC/MtrF-like protein